MDRRTPGLDDEVGGSPVQRITLAVELTQTSERVRHLQQRSVRVVPQPPKKFFGCRAQVDDAAMGVQCRPVGLADHDAAAGGQDTLACRHQARNRRFFEVTKRGLALTLEEVPDAGAELALDQGVAVDKLAVQPPRQVPPDRGFAPTGQTHEGDQGQLASPVGTVSMAMFWLTEVARPLGEVKVTVIVPEVTVVVLVADGSGKA